MMPLRLSFLFLLVFLAFINFSDVRLLGFVTMMPDSLFHPSSSLSTVTPGYSSGSLPLTKEVPDFYRENKEYTNYTASVHINDSNELAKNINLQCNPSNMGYSIKSGELVFPNYTYPLCSELNTKISPKMFMDYQTNTFSMECNSGSPYYSLEPTYKKGRLFQYGEIQEILEISEYKKPVKLTVEEFAYGSCDGKVFNSALHFPRFKPELYQETVERMKELQQVSKPLIVMILTVDSYSRRHFFRKLPKTIELLNNLDPSYITFDFKLHNEFAASSIENMIPIFTDTNWKDIEIPREYDTIKEDSMWGYFKSKGFVTLFELEDCDHYFPNSIGRYPEVDYSVRSFYCAARYYTNLDFEIDTKQVQRCIGNHMSHYYTLNYTAEFTRLYSSLNQWIYMHINPAHEATGQHAATLDLDLVEFLQNYLQNFGKTHELAIFLQADHGMRYGNWYQDIEAYQENKLPAFFLIASKSLIDRIQYSYDNLLANSLRLTTKKDLRPSINYLADMPYFTPEKKEIGRFVNIFTDRAPLNRTCEELGISPFDCSCLVVQEIDDLEYNEELHGLALLIIEESLSKINSLVYTPLVGNYGLCEKLTFRNIINAYGLMLNNKVEELQLKFGVNENENAVFEVFAFVGTHKKSTVLIASSYRGSIVNNIYRGYRSRIKIFGIKRKDKYAGPCEDLTRALEIKSEYCICNNRVFMKLQNR